MKKSIWIVLGIVIILGIGTVSYFLFWQNRQSDRFSLSDKQWIENNKNAVIDLVILNNIPVFTATEEGVVFTYITAIEEETGLSFNQVPFSEELDVTSLYQFVAKEQLEDNDLLFYEDNFVLLTKEEYKFYHPTDIPNITIGVLEKDIARAKVFLGENGFEYVSVDSYDQLFLESDYTDYEENGDEENSEFQAIVVPKLMMLDKIMKTDFHIAFNISDMKLYYVLELGAIDSLNNILSKYYNVWQIGNYDRKFNENFNDLYFSEYRINEKEQADFKSKRYRYGYYQSPPFDFLLNDLVYGINVQFLKDFSLKTGIDFKYSQYLDFEQLEADLKNQEIDLIVTNDKEKFDHQFSKTVAAYNLEFVVVSDFRKNTTINSIGSLLNEEVIVFENKSLLKRLEDKGISYQSYDSIDDLVRYGKNKVIVLDKYSFQFYRENKFQNYKTDYNFTTENQTNFIVLDNEENKDFYNYFNFYLSFVNNFELVNEGFARGYYVYHQRNYLLLFGISSIVILGIGTGILIRRNLKTKNISKSSSSKENRLKYIDLLTSLKNRNYLNDKINQWDNSGIYPQAVVVVDLNNVAYVNDNYGHAEGDNLIKEAANLLISGQEENSDIIRTSGNEFLIYLVGHDEKQINGYVKKIQKGFEGLSHGFGAAVGYSIIEDEIKTIDDAINEATIDMRNKKVIE